MELLGIGNYYDKNVSWKIKFLDSRIPSNSSSLRQFFILDQVVWNANDLEKLGICDTCLCGGQEVKLKILI